MRSGSGWVAVAPVDAAEQGGSNGGGGNMVVAVLAELQWFENEAEKIDKNGKSVMLVVDNGKWWKNGWQWLGGSGTSRCSGARRFEWWWWQYGSGSIGRVAVV
jgi:hypothetical protein